MPARPAHARLHKHPRIDRLTEQTEQLDAIQPTHLLDNVDPELATDHGGDVQHPRGRLRQGCHKVAHHVPDASRHRYGPGRSHSAEIVQRIPLLEEQRQFSGEQRVAVGMPVQRLHRATVDRTPGHRTNKLTDLRLGESAEAQHEGLPTQVQQCLAEGRARSGFGLPVRRNDDDRQRPQDRCDVSKQAC